MQTKIVVSEEIPKKRVQALLIMVLNSLMSEYADLIVQGMNRQFKHYISEDPQADFKEFLKRRGHKKIKAYPVSDEGIPILPSSVNKAFMQVGDLGLEAMKSLGNLKNLTLNILKLIPGAKTFHKKLIDPTLQFLDGNPSRPKKRDPKIPSRSIKKKFNPNQPITFWVSAMSGLKRNEFGEHTGKILFFNVNDVADEILDEYNDFLTNELGPERYRKLAEKTIKKHSKKLTDEIVNLIENAIKSNKSSIESGFEGKLAVTKSFRNFVTKMIPFIGKSTVQGLKKIRRIVFPSSPKMTEEALLKSLVVGIRSTQGEVNKTIQSSFKFPNVNLLLEILKSLNLSTFQKSLESHLIPKLQAELNPVLYERAKFGSQVVKLAYMKPHLRENLLPLIAEDYLEKKR